MRFIGAKTSGLVSTRKFGRKDLLYAASGFKRLVGSKITTPRSLVWLPRSILAGITLIEANLRRSE